MGLDNYQDVPFKPGVRLGVRHCASEYRDHVVALMDAICKSKNPSDIACLIKSLMDYPLSHPTLDVWLDHLPKVPGRCVRFRRGNEDEGGFTDAPLVAIVEDIFPTWDSPEDALF